MSMNLNQKLSKLEVRTYQALNMIGLIVLFAALAAIYFCDLDFYIGMFIAFLGKFTALFFGYAYENQIRVWGISSLINFLSKKY